jgi:pimeloyl-ACP methyl ester carboxylesterase
MPTCGSLYYSSYHDSKTETPPIVLIHGAGGTHLYWPPEIRRLKGYCVYAIDLPGHGKSDARDGQQSIAEYARQIIQWLEASQLRRAVLVGHSMGGAIALTLAIHHPEYVLGLGLIGAGARMKVRPELLSYISDSTTFYKATKFIVSSSFSPAAPPRLVELASRRMEVTRQSVLYGDLVACDHFDVMNQLDAIRQSTLVLCGADDQLTPVRYAQYLSRLIPNACLCVVPNAGHMVMLEQPHLVAERLLLFLKDISFYPGEGL